MAQFDSRLGENESNRIIQARSSGWQNGAEILLCRIHDALSVTAISTYTFND